MDASKKWMKDNGFMNKISFQDGAAHTVKILKDKEDSLPDGTKGMKYLVEEDGEQKTIFTTSVGLVGKLSLCNEGDVVTIQMKKANNKSFYTVLKGDGEELQTPDEVGEIQVGDDDEPEKEPGW